MSEEIIKVLDYIGDKLGIAIDWSSANVWPQVLNILGRYRVLKILLASIGIILELAIITVAVVLLIKSIQGYIANGKIWCVNYSWGYEPSAFSVLAWIGSIVAFIVFFIFLCGDICDLLRWTIVPEVQYVEMLQLYIQ